MKNIITQAVIVSALTLLSSQAFANNELEFELEGRVMVDYIGYGGIHNEGYDGSEWLLRRARFGIKHKSNKDWEAELEIDIDHAKEEVSISNGYIAYTGWDWSEIAFGHMKENFGLEETTSSLNISTMERSLVTEAFAPGRNFGVQLTDDSDVYSWSIGLFQASEDKYGYDGYAYTGRFTLSPINRPGALLHLGVSGSLRDMLGTNYEINEPLGVSVGDSVLESSEIATDTINQVALEAAIVTGAFSFQSEWMQQQVKAMPSAEQQGYTASYSGYYFLGSFFLTGESRVYDDGSFDETSPSSDKGAWEIVAQYNNIDLVELSTGATAKTYLIGLNYYVTGRAKLMLNLSRTENDSTNPDETGEGDAVAFRAQYQF